MKQHTKRLVSFLLCLCMVLGIVPVTALAADANNATSGEFVSETHTLFSSTSSVIAPGVTSSTNYAYSKSDGKQMVYYVATADINRDDVEVHSSYIGAQIEEYGMDKLSNQMKAANEKYQKINPYFQAVAGVNGDFYNMTTGQPSGAFYMDGKFLVDGCLNRPWFAIFEDGTATCGAGTTDWNAAIAAHGAVQEAVGGSQMLVKNGQDVTANASGAYNTDRHSRSMVGVTADNKVVIVTLDGRQEPFSCGGTMHELAQIMLEQGCVIAINLDGGGSSTFITRPEGENEIKVINRPSDGSERSISSGLLIASTAIPSDVFERATLTAENEYVTPGSTVTVSAKGVSSAGTAATIPANATWSATLGTVENGVFVSDGTVGDAEISMLVDGVVVGTTTIHVVLPDSLSFNQADMVVPYGKTVTLGLTATYGLNQVVIKPADIVFTLGSNEIGTISGFDFTSAAEGVATTSTTITATITGTSVTASANLSLGKGSEVVLDFEDGSLGNIQIVTGYPQYGPGGQNAYNAGTSNGQNEVGQVSIVTAENGQVHDGKYALAVECDFSQPYETGYHLLDMKGFSFTAPANAQTVGMWIYIPELEELYTTSLRIVGVTPSGSKVASPWLWDNCTPYSWDNDGWRYVTMDISGYSEDINFYLVQLYICDRDNAAVDFTFSEHASVNGRFTYYFDNFTLDYSSAVDDREPPVFADLRYADGSMSDAVSLNGQTVTDSVVSFGAIVHENTAKSNYTGLDESTAKAYIDGIEVDCTYSGGTMSIADAKLSDGIHTIKFSISDKMGNSAYITRQINIASGSGAPTISIVPENPSATKILIGSLYWMNMVASDIELVDEVTVEFNLNSMSQWELDHMVVADGFEATYTYDYVSNNATITVKKVGTCDLTGEQKLVQIPIRTWESRLTESPYSGYATSTPQNLWSRKIIWPIDIKLSTYLGSVTYTDGTTGSFSMAPISVITELYGNYAELNANGDYANKKSWHLHTETAVADVEATCTADGCVGKTFCEVCNSVVNWGTVIPGGHNYEAVEGVLACSGCGELLNGVHTDGKFYVDGVVIADGWTDDNRYYLDGVMYQGMQIVDGLYYDFGEDGICLGRFPYNGWYTDEAGNSYLLTSGEPATGYKFVDQHPTNFYENGIAWQGEITIGGETCVFDKGVFVESTTADVLFAGLCGDKAYFVLYADGTLVISGEGATYDYTMYTWKTRPWGNYGNDASQYSSKIKKVVVGKDITVLGLYSFQHCYNIASIEFEEGSVLHTLKAHAFHYASKLKEIELPDSLKTMEYSALGYCENLLSVKMPENISSINDKAFWNNSAKMVLNVVEDSYAHQYAVNKGYEVILRESLPVVLYSGTCGEGLTWELYNTGLLAISGEGAMPDYSYQVYHAEATPWALYRSKITKITIGAGVERIGSFAFYQCTNLEEVTFEENSKLSFIATGSFGYTKALKTITLPASVETIDTCGFYFSGLETVAFAENSNLKTIGNYAFRDCTSLTSVYIPDSVSSIGFSIFVYCGDQVVMSVPEDSYAHKYAVSKGYAVTLREPIPVVLYSGTCGEGLTWELYNTGLLAISGEGAMPDYSYRVYHAEATPWALYRDQIEKITIGAGVERIGSFAFYQCTNLEEVTFEENSKLSFIATGSFGYTKALKTITLPASVETIDTCGFYFSGLETVAFAENSNLKTIGNYAFRDCTSLTSVYIPDSVSSIGFSIFVYCGDQVVMSVPEDSYAHKYAVSKGYAVTLREPIPVVLYSGTCGEGLTWELYNTGLLAISGEGAMPDYSYRVYHAEATPWALYRDQIEKIFIGAGVERIGSFAFYQCTNLEEVTFEENSKLSFIATGSFGYTKALKTITLPASVETIDTCGFYFSGLETVAFAENSNLKTIGNYAFRDCTSLVSVYIPDSVTSIGFSIFVNCGDQVVADVAEGSYAHKYAVSKGYAVTTR